mgnify:FL=1
MKKRKGFTLAELLAVIVILGIITSITVPIVTDQIDKYKTKVCVTQYDNILNAARSYGADHLTELGKSKTITLKTLNDDGYIDASNMKDPITKNTISQDLKIIIEKVGKKYKYFLSNNEDIGCKDDYKNFYDKNSLFIGIPSKEYTQGDKVEYLGYKWLVMKDNGETVRIIMNGYLSSDDLNKNKPKDVIATATNEGMKICDETNLSNTYCSVNVEDSYNYQKSIIKPTIENWIDEKMTQYGYTKGAELTQMTYTDGEENLTSWIRIPTKEETDDLNYTCISDGLPYCASTTNYMYANYHYWTLTKNKGFSSSVYGFIYLTNNSRTGGVVGRFPALLHQVRPVITVNKN